MSYVALHLSLTTQNLTFFLTLPSFCFAFNFPTHCLVPIFTDLPDTLSVLSSSSPLFLQALPHHARSDSFLTILNTEDTLSQRQLRLCFALPHCSLLNRSALRLLADLKHPLQPAQPIISSLLLSTFQDQRMSPSLPYNTSS